MVLANTVETVPLRYSDDGLAIYIGKTRIPLETVIRAFHRGATPEEIVVQFPALSLAEVYLVIGYYLNHRDEVEEYIEQAKAHAEQVRRKNEARFDTTGLRERLITRLQKKD